MDDALVIDRVRAGRTEAFSHIVERYEAPIKRYLIRITGDFDVAQDLAQDTFFHVADSTELDGGQTGDLHPLEGTQSMWCGVALAQ